MKSQTKKLLLDVVEAGRSIQARCEGHSFAEYEADRWFRRTVEREFEIVAEALNRLDHVDPAVAAAISELSGIVAFRNRIIHGYDRLCPETPVASGHPSIRPLKRWGLLRVSGEIFREYSPNRSS
jgi:uncharacterized protein with HEPN domain